MERERKTNSRNHSIAVKFDRETQFILRKVITDAAILFCIGFLVLAYYLWGQPYKRGFFCDDESLKHPFKESTVTSVMLYLVGLGLPMFTMCLTEWIRLRDYKGRPRAIFGLDIPPWVWEAYQVIGVFLFGCACQQLTTDVAKYTIGRLRPHFFSLKQKKKLPQTTQIIFALYLLPALVLVREVCKPNIDCSLTENRWRYIEVFECLGDDPKMLKAMRLSFPSGHSSFSAYTMIYFAMYIQKRFTWKGSKLFKHSLQVLLILMAWYTVMTRVSDYKHHWSDVLAGFSIGMIFAVLVFLFISNIRKTPRTRQTLNHLDAELHATNGNTRSATRVQV